MPQALLLWSVVRCSFLKVRLFPIVELQRIVVAREFVGWHECSGETSVNARTTTECVLWQTKESFSFILKKYVDYAKKHFNEGATIVFDDYPEDAVKSTKSVERFRRKKKHISGYVMFD
ncbi:hypothetical protein AVEN_48835-1 [Araneus ventricosus]|uniref:Uncharacterized protein n=1 Tax=Araneus ventricosus TaxID=182803 RepID=A0A4Y2AG65_ARAVE|nr:hypothetical protein AVEN_48835-1 [Araneus ventricosus]